MKCGVSRSCLKGVITGFGLRAIEKSIENPHSIFCSSFQNLRLGGITLTIPNEDFGRSGKYFRVHFEALLKGVSFENAL